MYYIHQNIIIIIIIIITKNKNKSNIKNNNIILLVVRYMDLDIHRYLFLKYDSLKILKFNKVVIT